MSPYRWEDESLDGKMLSDREPIQPQLLDPHSERVSLTVCMFGERCGLPLGGRLEQGWEERIDGWRSSADAPGILHPWPEHQEGQDAALQRGDFPLTGTVFELLSAHLRGNGAVVMGFVASHDLDDAIERADIVFNESLLQSRLSAGRSVHASADILRTTYHPQIHALYNLLRFLKRRGVNPRRYSTGQDMLEGVYQSAAAQLSSHFAFTPGRNPFKASLEHWRVDDAGMLPGRGGLSRELLEKLRITRFLLLRGRSGCGKSSLLQKGLLDPLRDKGHRIAVFRPADLADPGGARSRLDELWRLICDVIEGSAEARIDNVPARKASSMARRLAERLDALDINLTLGLDQFEEMLDELQQLEAEKRLPRGWWQVMSFLKQMLACPRFRLIGTLESLRVQTYQALKVDAYFGVAAEVRDVPEGADFIERIARDGCALAGLSLEDALVAEIKNSWDRFEQQQRAAGQQSSSPLPLAVLWLHQLVERFDHRATAADISAQMNSAARDTANMITLDDLGDEGVDFDGLISDLAEAAWDAAGAQRVQEGEAAGQPDPVTLENFLKRFVALDSGKQMRLPSASTAASNNPSLARQIQSFLSSRLLVPSGEGAGQARMVHQAVIDRWPPARSWYEARQVYLGTEQKLRAMTVLWGHDDGGDEFLSTMSSRERVQQAAQVLNENRATWPGVADALLLKDERQLRDFTLAMFSRATDPMELVQTSPRGNRFVHVAAIYGMTDLLETFVRINPDCVAAKTKTSHTPLHAAAWNDGDTVAFLLANGADPYAWSDEGMAIGIAVYSGSARNYQSLIDRVLDVNAPIVPGGSTLVHWAASVGDVVVLNDLIERGANPSAANESGQYPISWAASGGHEAAFRLLLSYCDLDDAGGADNSFLHAAASVGSTSVIDAFLYSELDEETIVGALARTDSFGFTPIMAAAYYKQLEVVIQLLGWCGPSVPVHATTGGTLLHLAMVYRPKDVGRNAPQKDEVVRVRRLVEVLLADGRIDPNAKDREGKTAHDYGASYREARKLIREDSRVSKIYADLTPEMRADDLGSRKSRIVLDLVRQAPEALTDSHGDATGLAIVLRNRHFDVIAALAEEGLVPEALFDENSEGFLALADGGGAQVLRAGLVTMLERRTSPHNYWPRMLNAAMERSDSAVLARLDAKGIDTVVGPPGIGLTAFHSLAINGDIDHFKSLAERFRLRLPLDAWGRPPSTLAADAVREQFRQLEAELFDPNETIARPDTEASPFHELAKAGSLVRFERLAKLADIAVPLDADGRRPSDIADEMSAAAIRDLEDRYFRKDN